MLFSMIRTLSIFALLLAVVLIALDYFVLRPRRVESAPSASMRRIEWLIYIVFLIALAGMVLSSILPLALGQRMHHWMLILHMTLAPLFSICIAALAVLWSGQRQVEQPEGATRFHGERIAFWLVVASSFVVIVSAMLGMMSWFGSEWQECLLNVHRGAAFVVLVAAAYQAARLLTGRDLGTQRDQGAKKDVVGKPTTPLEL